MDLRQGIRYTLSFIYPPAVALRMSIAPNYNYFHSKDHSNSCIILSADGSSFTEAILIDLYGHLAVWDHEVCTSACHYAVSIDGGGDVHKVNAVVQHYFWLNSTIQRRVGDRDPRFWLN